MQLANWFWGEIRTDMLFCPYVSAAWVLRRRAGFARELLDDGDTMLIVVQLTSIITCVDKEQNQAEELYLVPGWWQHTFHPRDQVIQHVLTDLVAHGILFVKGAVSFTF